MKMMLSIVVPAYNEARYLEANLKKLKRYLNKLGTSYEIIVAEDGSTDGTYEIARRIAKENKKIKLLHSGKKLGRGLALKRAFAACRGGVLGYIDADLAPDPKHIKEMLQYAKDYDVVIASRYARGASVRRPLLRDIVAKSYNLILRVMFNCNIRDFQCGLKLFSRRFFEKEIRRIKEKSWAWDTAVLIEALKKGYKIKEVPVAWEEKKESAHSASLTRLLKDFRTHGRMILRLFAKWNLGMKVSV